jgi:hypothetical protein
VEFLPGRKMEVPAYEVNGVPKYVMCRLARQANGTYALIPEAWNQMVRLTRNTTHKMGVPCGYTALYRLVKAGFVRGSLLTTHTILVDLGSVAEHIRATELGEDAPIFWTRDRIDRYRHANFGGAGAGNAPDEAEDE